MLPFQEGMDDMSHNQQNLRGLSQSKPLTQFRMKNKHFRGYYENRFALIHHNFLAAVGYAGYFVPPRPVNTS